MKGNMTVEFVLGLLIWAALVAGFMNLIRLGMNQNHAHKGARLGAFLMSTGRVTESTVTEEIRNYLGSLSRPVSSDWSVTVGRFLDTPSSRFYHLDLAQVSIGPLQERVVLEEVSNP